MDLNANESFRKLQPASSLCIPNDILDLHAVVVSSFILASYQIKIKVGLFVLFYTQVDVGNGKFLLPFSLSSFALLFFSNDRKYLLLLIHLLEVPF